jgi:hypothetical protein
MALARQLYPQESVEIRITSGDRQRSPQVGTPQEPGQWAELITPAYRSIAAKVTALSAQTTMEKHHAAAFGATEAKALAELVALLEARLPGASS